jgi:DNA-directed RNA polymerase specialized sigma24 family protein
MAITGVDRDNTQGMGEAETNVRALSGAALALRCSEETAKYLRHETIRDEFGLELFRRAICERDEAAWETIFVAYRGIVRAWIQRHPAWSTLNDDIDYWVNRAFERLWVAIDRDRFASFPNLAAVLRYLKLCAHSVILDELRVQGAMRLASSIDTFGGNSLPDSASAPLDDVTCDELLNAVISAAQTEAERVIAHLCFGLDMRPRDVYARYPDQFASIAEVYCTKRNLLDRLRRNPVIQQFVG